MYTSHVRDVLSKDLSLNIDISQNICTYLHDNKGEYVHLSLFIGNYVVIVLIQSTWHLIRLYVAPEPKWVGHPCHRPNRQTALDVLRDKPVQTSQTIIHQTSGKRQIKPFILFNFFFFTENNPLQNLSSCVSRPVAASPPPHLCYDDPYHRTSPTSLHLSQNRHSDTR